MQIYRTNAKENIYMQETEPLNLDYNCVQAVHLYPEHTYQTWKGFGGAFTEAAGYTWSKLTPVSQKEFTDAKTSHWRFRPGIPASIQPVRKVIL